MRRPVSGTRVRRWAYGTVRLWPFPALLSSPSTRVIPSRPSGSSSSGSVTARPRREVTWLITQNRTARALSPWTVPMGVQLRRIPDPRHSAGSPDRGGRAVPAAGRRDTADGRGRAVGPRPGHHPGSRRPGGTGGPAAACPQGRIGCSPKRASSCSRRADPLRVSIWDHALFAAEEHDLRYVIPLRRKLMLRRSGL
jgi:hypothetical protein